MLSISIHTDNRIITNGLAASSDIVESTQEKVHQETHRIRRTTHTLQSSHPSLNRYSHCSAIPRRSRTHFRRGPSTHHRTHRPAYLLPNRRLRCCCSTRAPKQAHRWNTGIAHRLNNIQDESRYVGCYWDLKTHANTMVGQTSRLVNFDWQLDMEVATEKGKCSVPVVDLELSLAKESQIENSRIEMSAAEFTVFFKNLNKIKEQLAELVSEKQSAWCS